MIKEPWSDPSFLTALQAQLDYSPGEIPAEYDDPYRGYRPRPPQDPWWVIAIAVAIALAAFASIPIIVIIN